MRTFIFILIFFVFRSTGLAQCSYPVLPTGPFITGIADNLDVTMGLTQTDNVHTDFLGIWIHSGWNNNFGPCASGSPWTTSGNFQNVLDAGKIPVIYYWWHTDQPQNLSLRTQAEQQLHTCLVPLLNQINRPTKEVWVVLQPEYNMNGAHLDPTFATHLITMIDDLKTNVSGVKIKVGPSAGNFGTVDQRYRLHPSMVGVVQKCDFIGFHDIQRDNPTTDAIWTYPIPGQSNACLSFCRFLSREYQKPLFFSYWTVSNSKYSQALQAQSLDEIFKHRAEFERYGVFGFGPFWYKSDASYPAEGLKSTSNSPFTVWTNYKNIANNIASNTTSIHSMAFLDLEYGNTINLPITLRWISRGKTGPITYSIYYKINGGAQILIASGLTGSSNEIMQLQWNPCNFPTAPVLNFVVVADDGTVCVSPKVSYLSTQSNSNATFTFESGSTVPFGAITPGVTLGISSIAAAGSKSLQVNLANNGMNDNLIKFNGPFVYTGSNTLDLMIYVPYSLNNTMEMGSEVTYCYFFLQTNSTWNTLTSLRFGLNQGWNKVTWNYTLNSGDPKDIYYLEIRFWNRMAVYNDVAKIYIDDVKFGGVTSYSNPTNSCATSAIQVASCTNNPLPMSLVSFTGKRISAQCVELNWSTSFEYNNDFFAIERSLDGGSTVQEIGKMVGQKNQSTIAEYSFKDFIGDNQVLYYRLKQIDVDGKSSYSNWITIESTAKNEFSLFPNPANESITIETSLDNSETYAIVIYNMLGEIVFKESGNRNTDERLLKTIEIKNLPQAVYFINFRSGKGNFTERFLKN